MLLRSGTYKKSESCRIHFFYVIFKAFPVSVD